MNKNQYNELGKLRDRLFEESKRLIISTLKTHGGRVTHPQKESILEGEYEESGTYPLDTDSGSSNIRMTGVYLGEFDYIYADGVEQEFNEEQNGLQLIGHQYEFALEFLFEVLGFASVQQKL